MEKSPEHSLAQNPEFAASKQLNTLLEDPEFAFLHLPQNMNKIENAETDLEALQITRDLIEAREQSTLVFKPIGEDDSEFNRVESGSIDYRGLRRTLNELNTRSIEIGVGGDANVFVAKAELRNGSYDVCYKFSKKAETPRGRNPMDTEAELQDQFHKQIRTLENNSIAVPKPFYYSEVGNQKFIAMEKLPARSIDDLRRGKGSIPNWVTERHIEQFIQDLIEAIDHCHSKNLYHRDLHFGNIMFTQSPTEVGTLGYIIDFGLSAIGQEDMDPYRKETNTDTFTYDNDYGRIDAVRSELLRLCRG